MAKTTNRTRPLDRDGDGQDGGSLPGNKTAPMAADTQVEGVEEITAEQLPISGSDLQGLAVAIVNATAEAETGIVTAEPVDDLADARTTPGDSPEKLEAIERETDKANAAAATAAADGAGDVADALNAIAETEPELVAQVVEDHAEDETYTFDAEQVEAAHGEAFAEHRFIFKRVDQVTLFTHLLKGDSLTEGENGYGIGGRPPYLPRNAVDLGVALGHWQVVDGHLIITDSGIGPLTTTVHRLLEEEVISVRPIAPITFDAEQVEAAHSEPMNLSLDQVKEALGDAPEVAAPIAAFCEAIKSIHPNAVFALVSHMSNGYPLVQCQNGYGWEGINEHLPDEAVSPLIEAGYLSVQDDELMLSDFGREPIQALLSDWFLAAKVEIPNGDGSTTVTTNEALGFKHSHRLVSVNRAYRRRDIEALVSSRFLYKSSEGYSPTYAVPFITDGVARMMLKDGLATFDKQAGNAGALRATPAAREALKGWNGAAF